MLGRAHACDNRSGHKIGKSKGLERGHNGIDGGSNNAVDADADTVAGLSYGNVQRARLLSSMLRRLCGWHAGRVCRLH